MSDFNKGDVVSVDLQIFGKSKWTITSNENDVLQLHCSDTDCPDTERTLTVKKDETGLYKRFPDSNPSGNKHYIISNAMAQNISSSELENEDEN